MTVSIKVLARLSDQVYVNWHGTNPNAMYSQTSNVITSYRATFT
jgi:hypothetical protein